MAICRNNKINAARQSKKPSGIRKMSSRRGRRSQQRQATMRAVVQFQANGPLLLTDMYKPVPPRCNPLIRVHTVGINVHDAKIRDNGAFVSSYPVIMGADVTGTIEEGTSPISGFNAGDRVAYMASPMVPIENGLQEFTVANAAYLIRLPEWMSFEAAATLGTNLTASWFSLFSQEGLALQPPLGGRDEANVPTRIMEGILIVNGCTHIGFYALQLARLAGLNPIITTAYLDGSGEEDLKELGATHVLDHSASDIVWQVKTIVGESLLYAYDTNARTSYTTTSHLLAQAAISDTRNGAKVVTSSPPGPRDQWVKKKVDYETTYVLGVNDYHPQVARELAAKLPWLLEEGAIVTDKWEIAGGLEDADAVISRVRERPKRRQLIRVGN